MAKRLSRFSSVPHASTRPHRRLLGCIALIVASVITACASGPKAESPDLHAKARIAFLAQDYQRTLSIVEPQAVEGAPWAQYTLGYMYYYGRGIELDRVRARQWIQQAADQGYPPAKEALRRMYTPAPPGNDVIVNTKPARRTGAPSTTEQSTTSKPNVPPAATENTPAPGSTAPPGTTSTAQPDTTMPRTTTPPPATSAGASENTLPPAATAAPPTVPAESPLPAPAPPVTEQSGLIKNSALPPTEPPPEGAASLTSPPPAAVGEVRNNAWIAAQDARHYTLQLIGSTERNAVTQYIRDRGLMNDAAYYTTTRDGQPWYVVIYGSYPDRDAAQAALLHLPSTLRAASPWIREFGDIQAHLTAP